MSTNKPRKTVGKPARPPKRPRDFNELAHQVFLESIGERLKAGGAGEAPEPPGDEKPPEPEKNPAAVELGRMGGLKGGKARAEKMTKEERAESARNAANARWDKSKNQRSEPEE